MITVSFEIEIDISGGFGVGETVIAKGGGGVDVFDQSVADKGDAHARSRNIIGGHLLVETEKDVWRYGVLSEEGGGAFSGVVFGVKKDEGEFVELLKLYRHFAREVFTIFDIA